MLDSVAPQVKHHAPAEHQMVHQEMEMSRLFFLKARTIEFQNGWR
jgi:hypothetical protein